MLEVSSQDYEMVAKAKGLRRRTILGHYLVRNALTPEELEAILARQISDEEKRRRADFIVDTSGDLSTTESQVRDILACLGVSHTR